MNSTCGGWEGANILVLVPCLTLIEGGEGVYIVQPHNPRFRWDKGLTWATTLAKSSLTLKDW